LQEVKQSDQLGLLLLVSATFC